MAKPSYREFKKASEQGNLVPVFKEFLYDTETPVSCYLKIKDRSFSYLLESAYQGKRWGRYSFIGYRPFMTVIFHDRAAQIIEGSKKNILKGVRNPLEVLRDLGRRFRPVILEEISPFQGGFVGYLNYELVRKWERLPNIVPEDNNIPESVFTVSSRLIIFDHLTHQVKVVAFARIDGENNLKDTYENACIEVEETFEELRAPLSPESLQGSFSLSSLKSNFKKENFKKAVCKAKDYIEAGDIIQVVLSQKFSGEMSGDDFMVYRNLRSINPSPYMFYLNFRDIRLIGSSPEILVRLTNGRIELRPIAGTRPRGRSPEQDQRLEKDLLSDPKERAEHIMLVDLGRNDVGRAAEPGSVSVPRLMEVEHYSHVMHIVSRVEGYLKQGLDAYDLFMAAFPAGTVSGAPKVRAMEIINELEPAPRGPYSGAVGYFGFNGNMDFCITIRTITVARNILSLQVGAGIVYDSSPEKEYQETLNKAAAMRQAINRVNGK